MGRIDNFRQYATDCMRRAEDEQRPEDRDILLNMALAWVRLAKQTAGTPAPSDGPTATPPEQSAA